MCWCVGLLVCWSVCVLVCWSVGLLVCWSDVTKDIPEKSLDKKGEWLV